MKRSVERTNLNMTKGFAQERQSFLRKPIVVASMKGVHPWSRDVEGTATFKNSKGFVHHIERLNRVFNHARNHHEVISFIRKRETFSKRHHIHMFFGNHFKLDNMTPHAFRKWLVVTDVKSLIVLFVSSQTIDQLKMIVPTLRRNSRGLHDPINTFQ